MGEALLVNNNNDDTDRFLYFFGGGEIEYCESKKKKNVNPI